jgi:integrase/recombinase XerD
MPEFSEFVRERKVLKNVTPRTLSWYEQSWKSWQKHSGTPPDPKTYVINLREAGVSATGVNSYARALNAYFRWSGLPTIPKLKEEQKVLPVFSANDIRSIIMAKTARTRTFNLCLLLLDTGVQIQEALSLRIKDIDFDNLLVTVKGKGNKSRVIPMSFELRKVIWKFNHDGSNGEGLLFHTRTGKKLSHRNTYRSIKTFLERINVTPPERMIHAFRHTFAINYLRAGGSVFHLQKVLGHASLEMTRRYANLLTEDLQLAHQKCSLLSRSVSGRF